MSSRRSFPDRLPALAAAALLLAAAAPAGAGEPLRYDRGVIREDTTWSGEVRISGQTVVKKGATLTVLPGTRVLFEWTDEDGDGIGDGELNVEGRIVARGTPERRITFASARPEPAPKDWTFIMISVSKESLLAYCEIRDAFTGVQVHYSTAVIRDCRFHDNFEGVRFSTTEVVIEHNDFVDNYYAIRCESNRSRAVITRNRIAGNRYGFFPVARTDAGVRVFENNVTDSSEYQVYLGQNQRVDLDFTNNWWGSADPAEIAAGFYDKSRDPVLGRVVWEPFLAAPVEPAGVRPAEGGAP